MRARDGLLWRQIVCVLSTKRRQRSLPADVTHTIATTSGVVSGTRVRSNNVISVYTGVINTAVGVGQADTMHEQMIPVDAYGFNFIAVPFSSSEFA